MLEENFARFKKLLQLLKHPEALKSLQETKALEIKLSPCTERYLDLSGYPLEKFCNVLPHCFDIKNQTSFFQHRGNGQSQQFIWCFNEKHDETTAFSTFVIYISTDAEDKEFGLIETLLQISAIDF
jgi:hypothetical protein